MNRRRGLLALMVAGGITAGMFSAAPAQAAPAAYPTDGSVCQIGVSLPKKIVIDTDPSEWKFKIQNPNGCILSSAMIQFEQVKDHFGFQSDMTGDPTDVNRSVIYKGTAPYMAFGKTQVTQVNGDYVIPKPGVDNEYMDVVYRLLNHPTTDIRYASKLNATRITVKHGRITVAAHATRFEFGIFNSKYSAFKSETVKLQRYTHGVWKTITSAKTNSKGNVTLGAKDPRGKQSYRLVSADKGIVWGKVTAAFKR